jgi:hypothetical protein
MIAQATGLRSLPLRKQLQLFREIAVPVGLAENRLRTLTKFCAHQRTIQGLCQVDSVFGAVMLIRCLMA